MKITLIFDFFWVVTAKKPTSYQIISGANDVGMLKIDGQAEKLKWIS